MKGKTKRQELSDHLLHEHDLVCLESELDLIINIIESFTPLPQEQREVPTEEVIPILEEIWDEYSEYLDTDIDSLQMQVGTNWMPRTQFMEAGKSILSRLPNQARVSDDEIKELAKKENYSSHRDYLAFIKGMTAMRDRPTGKEEEWISVKVGIPVEGATIRAKIMDKIIKVTISGDFYDYGITEWMPEPNQITRL